MIKSTDREVRALIDALGADEARREAAIARLTIIGGRAVARLVDTFDSSTDRDTRIAILRVLEESGDDRVLPVAKRAVADGGDVAVQAVSVLEQLMQRGSLPVQEDALEALLAVSADSTAARRVRTAAAGAIDAVSRDIAAPVPAAAAPSPAAAAWADAADGQLPDDPRVLRGVIGERAPAAPLPVLHRLVEAVRARETAMTLEGGAKAVARRDDWRAVRGALHQALALRGSRIALYDLRETFAECADALPHTFVAAVRVIGDASCLEPLARAHARAAIQDDAWRHQLATAFQEVVRRERLTQRHAALRRALTRAPQLAS